MSNDNTSARGRSVKTVRGYVVMEWTGQGVDSGYMQPFSVGLQGSFDKDWSGGSLADAEAFIQTAPTLRVVLASIKAYVPVATATDEEIDAWVKFSLHNNGSLSGTNPLINHEFEAHEVFIDDVREVK